MNIIDRRAVALGHSGPGRKSRPESAVTHIVVHHTAGAVTGNTASFENFWQSRSGWDRGGYHEVVLHAGDVELNYDPTFITWGAANQNGHTYHIALVGDFSNGSQPSEAQWRSLFERVRLAMGRLQVPVKNVVGHNELPGQATLCNSLDMNRVRQELLNWTGSASTKHVVSQGETLTRIAVIYNTTVEELVRLNQLADPDFLKVGQILLVNRNTSEAIGVGARVRLKSTAIRWATGERIADSVRHRVFEVAQMRAGGSEALLAGVVSWAKVTDLERAGD